MLKARGALFLSQGDEMFTVGPGTTALVAACHVEVCSIKKQRKLPPRLCGYPLLSREC